MALRIPISRVRSVTLTNMMFMTPMPPTRREIAATAPRRKVRVLVVDVAVESKTGFVQDLKGKVRHRGVILGGEDGLDLALCQGEGRRGLPLDQELGEGLGLPGELVLHRGIGGDGHRILVPSYGSFPLEASTPTTSQFDEPSVICCPMGFDPVAKRLLATSEPMSTTWACASHIGARRWDSPTRRCSRWPSDTKASNR
jgi:hypothetical protein